MMPGGWIAAGAALALLVGVALLLAGRRLRRWLGLGEGRTVALDNVTLTSRRYGLTGRMDRLIRVGNMVTPEEWKSSRSVWPNHKAQRPAGRQFRRTSQPRESRISSMRASIHHGVNLQCAQ